jgi:hypothetical protein
MLNKCLPEDQDVKMRLAEVQDVGHVHMCLPNVQNVERVSISSSGC